MTDAAAGSTGHADAPGRTGRLTSTLLVPTLNEIESIQVIMPQIDPSWVDEILCLDGGSTDGTVEWFRDNGYRVLTQENKGFGEAMRLGLMTARTDVVVEFTPDGNSPPEAIPKLIEKVGEGYDLVVASRYKGDAKSEDDDWLTGFGNWLFTTFVNVLHRTRYTDVLVGYRAYRREAMLTLGMDCTGLGWPCQGSIRFARAGFRVTEIPVDEPARIGGERKMRPFKTGFAILKLVVRELFATRRRKRSQHAGL